MPRKTVSSLITFALIASFITLAVGAPPEAPPPDIICPVSVGVGQTLDGVAMDNTLNQFIDIEFEVDGEEVAFDDDGVPGTNEFSLEIAPEWAGKVLKITAFCEDGRKTSRFVNVL
jgi:hypothetical protein